MLDYIYTTKKKNNMGIKNLNTVLRSKCPQVFKLTHLSKFAYKKVAIDITLFLCKFKSTAGENWLLSFLNLIACLRRNEIHCVFIYDNGAPIEKTEERAERVKNREKTEQRILSLENALENYKKNNTLEGILEEFNIKLQKELQQKLSTNSNTSSSSLLLRNNVSTNVSTKDIIDIPLVEAKLKRMRNYIFNITPDDFELTRKLFDILKVPYHLSPMEAETMCSDLCKRGLVDCVMSEDTDVLAYGAPCFLTKLDVFNDTVVAIEFEEVIKELKFTRSQFLDLSIMLGCDYNKSVKKIGPETSYKLISQYKNIETLIKLKPELDFSVLKHERCRELFLEYERSLINTDKISYCGFPDFEALDELLKENNFKFNIEKFRKAVTCNKSLVFVSEPEEKSESVEIILETESEYEEIEVEIEVEVDEDGNEIEI